MPGWIGGDRMNKRTQLVGQDPQAYEGEDLAFMKDVEICLDMYRETPQKDGSSPNDKRRSWIETGWKAVGMDYGDLVFAFSECKKLTVGAGRVQYLGNWYFADLLIPLSQHRIEFHVAKWAPQAIYHVDDSGKLHAIPLDQVFDQQDGEGAREQSRRNGVVLRHVRQLKAQTEAIDLLEESARFLKEMPPPPVIPFGPVISTAGGLAITQALADMAEPAPVKLLPGQLRHPTHGDIIDIRPSNEEGPKPTAIDFDPLKFAPLPQEAQKANAEESTFDPIEALRKPTK